MRHIMADDLWWEKLRGRQLKRLVSDESMKDVQGLSGEWELSRSKWRNRKGGRLR